MRRYNDPFVKPTGSERLASAGGLLMVLASAVFAGWIIAVSGLPGLAVLAALPLIIVGLIILGKKPVAGYYTAVAVSFVLLGATRYIGDLPVGLVMDGLLILTFIAYFFSKFKEKILHEPFGRDVMWVATVWLLFTLLQFANPEAESLMATLTGFRGIGLYMFFVVLLVLLMIDSRKKLDTFFMVWAVFSLLATTRAFLQIFIGPDSFELEWLNRGGAVTHVIQGNLRAFSFMSDAGQFGANQAFTGVVFSILAFAYRDRSRRYFFLFTAAAGFAGLVLSGTRGALAVPLAGFFLFAFLRKDKFIMIAMVLALVMLFVFFRHTYIGQGNQYIRRLRTAFNPNEASLQVRLENQRILAAYLSDKPFGGGIGHAGVKARRFLPDAYLSNIPTDSWYVLIWAEMGITGLILHLFILFYIIGKSSYLIFVRIRDPEVRLIMTALTSGMAGVMVGSYGNAVLGTMPTSILLYTGMALTLNALKFDEAILKENAASGINTDRAAL